MHVAKSSCNNPVALERPSSRSAWLRRASPRSALGIAGIVIAGIVTGAACRIYREPPREGEAAPISPEQGGSSAGGAPALERDATKPSAPAADALNLWVLNRPKEELPSAAESPAPSPGLADVPRPAAAAVVVLGVGAAAPCAEQLARRTVDALAEGGAPLAVLAAALDGAWRWRWPEAPSTLSAIVKSSTGAFGGVQSAPAAAFGVALLTRAIERRGVLGGPRAPWPVEPGAPSPELGACDGGGDPSRLSGPVGVLLRDRAGDFFGGVVHLDPLPDAGVVSVVAQYGVSLAVGAAGGVLVASDCDPPPLGRVAEGVYASPNWVLATAELPSAGGCRLGHALIGAARAWLAPEGALGAAIADAGPTPPAPAIAPERAAPAPAAQPSPPDAGPGAP